MNFWQKKTLVCLVLPFIVIYRADSLRAVELARVNAQTISEDDFRQALLSLGEHTELVLDDLDLKRRFLDYLIDVELRVEAAKKKRIDKSPEFRKRLKAAEKQVLSSMLNEAWEQELESHVLLQAAFKKEHEFYIRSAVHVAHIYLGEQEDAKRVLLQALNEPETFSKLVRKYSRSNAQGDGDLGWLSKGQQELNFERAVFNAPKGAVYPQVVASGAGFHILKIIDIKYFAKQEFQDLVGDVKAVRRREISKDHRLSLLEGAKIEKNLTKLGQVKP